jgi:PIN domain nuclease of toxin-antitoxin system
VIHLDSHIAIWAYAKRARLSSTARGLLSREVCQVSPIVLLEIEGLFELGRISADADTILSGLDRQLGLTVSKTPILDVVNAARSFAWTHEPFDRLIVGAAIADGVQLVTADALILQHFKDAIW